MKTERSMSSTLLPRARTVGDWEYRQLPLPAVSDLGPEAQLLGVNSKYQVKAEEHWARSLTMRSALPPPSCLIAGTFLFRSEPQLPHL